MNFFSLYNYWYLVGYWLSVVIRYFLIFVCSLAHGHQVWTPPMCTLLYTTLGGNLITHPSCPTLSNQDKRCNVYKNCNRLLIAYHSMHHKYMKIYLKLSNKIMYFTTQSTGFALCIFGGRIRTKNEKKRIFNKLRFFWWKTV